MYEYSCLPLYDTSVNFYLSLRTNHWFKKDEEWGNLLSNFKMKDLQKTKLTTNSSNIAGDVLYATF